MEISQESVEIIERLKELRARTGLSQAKFAQLIGVSPGNISAWESGGSLPGALALKNITKNLGCSADWILTGVEQTPPETQKIEAVFDPDLKRMIDVLKELMESDNPHMRSWAIVQFENAFKQQCAAQDEKKLHA